jgi:hypothetical protein
MGRFGDLEIWRWGDLEMGRFGDGEMGRWGDGEMGRWKRRSYCGKVFLYLFVIRKFFRPGKIKEKNG